MQKCYYNKEMRFLFMQHYFLEKNHEELCLQESPEFYSCYATKADCILNQVGNQLLYYGL